MSWSAGRGGGWGLGKCTKTFGAGQTTAAVKGDSDDYMLIWSKAPAAVGRRSGRYIIYKPFCPWP